jgi:hypothetical protein
MEDVLVEMFHDPVRLGHVLIYKLMERERNRLFEKVMRDYDVKPMDRYELEKIILSPHYLQLQFPKNLEEHYESTMDHAKRKRRMVSRK